MKDPLDAGTQEFPNFYDQHLINAVANLNTIFTAEGTKATPENEEFVAMNIKFDRLEIMERYILELEGRISLLESSSQLLLDKLVYLLGKDVAPS